MPRLAASRTSSAMLCKPELVVDPIEVTVDRLAGDAELLGDVARGQTLRGQPE